MKKLLLTMIIVILAGTGAFGMTFDVGNNKVDLYGSLRAFTVFNNTDKGDRTDVRDRSQFTLGLQGNSRMGVRWTQGDIFVHGELGLGGDAVNPSPTLRLLYGDYKFGGGSGGRIRIGQIATIANTHTLYERKLSQDNGLQGFGTLMEQRRFGINYEIGGFSASAVSMRQDSTTVTNLFNTTGLSSIAFAEIMPRFEVSYAIVPNFKVVGSYVKSSVVANTETVTDKHYHVDAGHIAVVANPKISQNATIVASGFYSVNGGLYQMVSIGGGFNDYEAVSRTDWVLPSFKELTSDKVEWNNTSAYGGAVALIVDAFEAGFGIQSAANDTWADNQTGMGVYANYKFRVANNFRITPEVGYLHSGDRRGNPDVKDTKGIQAGIQFRFDI